MGFARHRLACADQFIALVGLQDNKMVIGCAEVRINGPAIARTPEELDAQMINVAQELGWDRLLHWGDITPFVQNAIGQACAKRDIYTLHINPPFVSMS